MKNISQIKFILLIVIFCISFLGVFSKTFAAVTTISAGIGTTPTVGTLVGTNLYVSNAGTNNFSVIDTNTDTVTTTIAVGTQPQFSTLVAGRYLYAPNRSSNNVSVIDTNTNTVVATIAVGTFPRYATLSGTNLYVSNKTTNNVSVIDTGSNTVIATIAVGGQPHPSLLVGTKLYVVNVTGNSISVIDTNPANVGTYNTVIATIAAGTTPYGLILSGTNLYVCNQTPVSTVTVINTNTDTVIGTISMGASTSPQWSTLVGNNLYTNNHDANTVSIIDTNPASGTYNTVIATVAAGTYPVFSVLSGTNLFVLNQTSNNVFVFDVDPVSPTYNTVIDTIAVGTKPMWATLVGTKLYTFNQTANTVSVIDTAFTLTSSSGANGSITASETVDYGTDKTFDMTPALGYHVEDVLVDSVSVGAVASYTFTNVTEVHTISVTFAIDTHTLTYTAGAGGTISGTSPQTINYGSNGTLVTAIANPKNHFTNWSDGLSNASRTDLNVTNDLSVTANFRANISGSGSFNATNNKLPIIITPTVVQPIVGSNNTLTKTLKRGMTDNEVKILQQYLNTHGYIVSIIGNGSLNNETTYFGTKTKAAVIKFQLANGLVGDGVVGPKTRGKIELLNL